MHTVILLNIEFYMCPLQSFKVVALNFNSNLKSMNEEFTLSKLCTVLSLFNFEPTR